MNKNKTQSGIDEKLRLYLKKMQEASSYEEFCELLGKSIFEKMHDEEITDYQFGNYIVEALMTNDSNKVFGAFTGLSAESFMEKYMLVPNETMRYRDEISEATYCSLWDGDILIESQCMINLKTREIFDIEPSGISGDSLNVLEEESVEIEDIKVPACKKDELDEDDMFTFWYE